MYSKKVSKGNHKSIDWMVTLVPFVLILGLSVLLFIFPEKSNAVISQIRFFFGNTMGMYYLVIGLGILLLSFGFLFQIWRYRTGEAGRKTKILFLFLGQYDVYLRTGRRYSILLLFRMGHVCFQSICCTDGHGHGMGRRLPIISLEFHPLGFLSGTCSRLCLYAPRPENPTSALLGSLPSCDWPPCGRHPGPGDRSVRPVRSACWHSYDLQCGYPLMASIIVRLFHIEISRTMITIIILLITCAVYTYAVLHGFKGISLLAKLCIYLFFGLLIFVLLVGGQGRFILENGFQSLGKMIQNFIGLATYTDPGRTNNFPQDWTIYYWAYWMVWCIAAPFFIGNISRGRTIRQTILGGYLFGRGIHHRQFHRPGELLPGTAAKRNGGLYRTVRSGRRPVFTDSQYHRYHALRPLCPAGNAGVHDPVLCDIL